MHLNCLEAVAVLDLRACENPLSWLACTRDSHITLPPTPAASQQEEPPVHEVALLQSLTTAADAGGMQGVQRAEERITVRNLDCDIPESFNVLSSHRARQ
jgi:hypothetical protein